MASRPSYLWAGVAAFAVVFASVAAAVLSSTGTKEAPPATPSLSVPGSPAPAVAKLSQNLVLLSHGAKEATTEFGIGVLVVSLPIDSDGFRWVEGAAPVSGGRMKPADAPLSLLPKNLPVVFSYDTSSRSARVSVFGRLAAPPKIVADMLVYEIALYDAPGKDSTYTVSGSYDIPETVLSATVSVFGQRLES